MYSFDDSLGIRVGQFESEAILFAALMMKALHLQTAVYAQRAVYPLKAVYKLKALIN